MHEQFSQLAESELEIALSAIPSDPLSKSALFVELIRAMDYVAFLNPSPEEHGGLSQPDYEVLINGWKLAARYLLTPIKLAALPSFESTKEIRTFAFGLLHKFGQTVLLNRVEEMIRARFLKIESSQDGFIVSSTSRTKNQLLDNLEFKRVANLKAQLNDLPTEFFGGWRIFDIDNLSTVENRPGAFMSARRSHPLGHLRCENVDELMLPLIRPWNSGRGIMMAYGALPEVDDHFLAEATLLVDRWRNEIGLHPSAVLGSCTGTDLTLIVAFITALHMKHVRFARLAMENFPEISIPQSLTIWGPLSELEDSIVDYSSLERSTVRNALNAITLRADEATQLATVTGQFIPLLVDLGNELVLRPVSSLARNPFATVRALLELRDPKLRHQIGKPREEWLRTDLYNLFQGTRYQRVAGTIKIRDGKNIVTDIDAAVLDTLTGELALFQLKWQDYFTNDVRELRSKAYNLTKELDRWAQKVEAWIEKKGKNEVARALRLKSNKRTTVSHIYLFGLSRTYARTRGFGYTIANEMLAIANWPQFVRARHEIGPAKRVFSKLFEQLKQEMDATVKSKPLPFTIQTGNATIRFEDLWNIYVDDVEE